MTVEEMMIMTLREMMYRRKSTRSYTGQAPEADVIERILDFTAKAKPLYPGINVCAKVLSASQVSTVQPWKTPCFLAFFSEKKEGWLENAGFILQQTDLFIQSLGLGSCWVGLGSLRDESACPEGMQLCILMPFGIAREKPWREDLSEFKRKEMDEISDLPDPRLEPARLAPSATNGQPWFFVHEGEDIHLFRYIHGPVKRRFIERFTFMDMGIALCHVYLAHPDTFRVFPADNPPEKDGYAYALSFRI